MTVKVVDVLTHRPVQGASVMVGGLGVETDAEGMLRLTSRSSELVRVRARAAGYVERETGLRLTPTPQPIVLSLIPTSFDMVGFDSGFRSAGQLRRWQTNPRLVMHASVFSFPLYPRATDETLTPDTLSCFETHLEAALPELTGGTLSFAGTQVLPPLQRGDAAERFNGGAITLFVGGFCSDQYGCSNVQIVNQATVHAGVIERFESGRSPYCDSTLGRRLTHLLGHALGLQHVLNRPSFMTASGDAAITAEDRQAIAVQYQRPAGNRSPDTDPDGFSLN